jgi:hypothetical protein
MLFLKMGKIKSFIMVVNLEFKIGYVISMNKIIEDFEYIRQGFADVLDLIIPYLPEDRQQVATISLEAYHKFVDKKVIENGGETVGRDYKLLK